MVKIPKKKKTLKSYLKQDYVVKYSLDVLKKETKVINISSTDKICFMKINIESSPPEI